MNDLMKRARIGCSDDPIGMEKKKFQQGIYSGPMENMRPVARQTVIHYYIYYFYRLLINEWIERKPFWVTVPKLPGYYIKLESHIGVLNQK